MSKDPNLGKTFMVDEAKREMDQAGVGRPERDDGLTEEERKNFGYYPSLHPIGWRVIDRLTSLSCLLCTFFVQLLFLNLTLMKCFRCFSETDRWCRKIN